MPCSPEQIPNTAYRIPALPLSVVQRMDNILLQYSLLVWRGRRRGVDGGGGGVGGGSGGGGRRDGRGCCCSGASVWILYDVDAFTDLNLNIKRENILPL